MSTFISLEQFLLLRDPTDREPKRAIGHLTRGTIFTSGWDLGVEIVERYRLAQASFKLFGEEGPKVGTRVIALVAGHGGDAGVVRTFNGIYEPDPRFFAIEQTDSVSLVVRGCWWAQIAPESLLKSTCGWVYELSPLAKEQI